MKHVSSEEEALRLTRAFFTIRDQKVRRAIVDLVEAEAKQKDQPEQHSAFTDAIPS
jgi:hypothetical protein